MDAKDAVLTGVFPHVDVQIARVRETLATLIAFKRLLECVLAHMNRQIA